MKFHPVLKKLTAAALSAVLLCSAAGAVLPVPSSAASSGEIQSQIDELESQKSELQSQMQSLQDQQSTNLSEITDVVNQKNNIDQQISLLMTQITNINDQITAYGLLIADKQDELDAAQARLDDLNEKNKERIRSMEEDGKLSYWSVLFKATSFSDLLDRINMIDEIAAADQRRLKEISDAAAEVKAAQTELESEKTALEQNKTELDASQEELTAKRAEADDLLQDLISRGEEYQALLDSRQSDMDSILDQIAQQTDAYYAQLEAERKAQEEATRPTEPDPTEPNNPDDPDPTEPDPDPEPDTPSSSGWYMPCSYVYVSSPFSDGRYHPILGYVRPHKGIDLAAYWGTPVYASRSGYVTIATYDDECGNYVFINHGDGFSSGYLHMSSYVVSYGDYVSAGEVIGYVGSTGLSEGPHLHFAITYNGTYVNPANYIDF